MMHAHDISGNDLQALSYLILTATPCGRGDMITSVLVKVTLTAATDGPQISKTQYITFIFGYAAKSSLVFQVGWPGVIQIPSFNTWLPRLPETSPSYLFKMEKNLEGQNWKVLWILSEHSICHFSHYISPVTWLHLTAGRLRNAV